MHVATCDVPKWTVHCAAYIKSLGPSLVQDNTWCNLAVPVVIGFP
jgi:hypothetical protein